MENQHTEDDSLDELFTEIATGDFDLSNSRFDTRSQFKASVKQYLSKYVKSVKYKLKVFEVVYETDGLTVKAPGVSETEVKKCSILYAASSITDVVSEIKWLLDDPTKTVVGISEVCPSIVVLPVKDDEENQPSSI